MADLNITPDQIAKAREAGYSDDEIADHLAAKAPEKFKAARDAGYSSSEILTHLSGSTAKPAAAPAADPSVMQDLAAGTSHGFKEAYRGGASTLKNIAGVDVGDADKADPNYVPANVTHGSWNPLKWSYRDIPKMIAEQSPMAAASVASAEAGAAAGSLIEPGVGTLVGGALGAGTPYAIQMVGDAAKARAVNRTGDPNAVPALSDKLIGGGTAAGSAVLAGLMHTPMAAPFAVASGIRGMLNSGANLATRAGTGATTGVAQNLVNQAGEKIGTGVPIDTASLPESAVGSAAGGTLPHVLPAVATAGRAARMGKYDADPEAAANYATRLQNTGLDLANIHEAAQAHQKVMADTHGELKAALDKVVQQKAMSPEETNAVASIRRGDTITPKDMEHLATATAGTPDGANAHFLARALKTGQQAEGEGSFDPKTGWQGSATGGMKNVVRGVFNPWHIGGTMAGLGALAFGMPHVSGAVGGGLMAGLAGGLGGARLLDSITGGSRPAANFAKTFADHNAQLRQGTAPAPAQPPPIPQSPNAPWGPRPPMTGPTGPQVAPPGAPPQAPPQFNPMALQMLKKQLATPLPGAPAPAPEAPPQAPEFNPMALQMLKQKLKAGLPPEPTPTPEAPPAPPPKPDISPMALAMLRQKLKAGLPDEPSAPAAPAAPAPAPTPAPMNPLMLPRGITGPAKNIVKGIAGAKDMQDEATKPAVSAIPAAAMKITKAKGGEVKATDPYAEAGSFQPIENPVYRGKTPQQIGSMVAAGRPELPELNRMGLQNSVAQTQHARDVVAADLANQLPHHAEKIAQMAEQLKEPGNSDLQYSRRAIRHYTDQMDPVSSHVVRERYKAERENIWPTAAEKKAAARQKAKAKKED